MTLPRRSRKCKLFSLAPIALAVCWLLIRPPALPPVSGADEAGGPKPASKLPPLRPLKVDKSSPLLLGEPTANEGKDQAFLRINDACYV